MIPIELNDYLAAPNPWGPRLLGLEPFQQERSLALIEREYDGELYGAMLEKHDDVEWIREGALNGRDMPQTICLGDEIFQSDKRTYHALSRRHMQATLDRFAPESRRCELGAGCGSNMIWQNSDGIYGGEITPNGRELGRRLGLEIHTFDFRDDATYDFIQPRTAIYTSHGVEQIADATPLIESLRKRRADIDVVIHFEPLYHAGRESFLGLLRNRYAELNDYNQNLLELVTEDKEIEVLHLERDVFGGNPLNPASILVWRFNP